jgi:hypothetical protein
MAESAQIAQTSRRLRHCCINVRRGCATGTRALHRICSKRVFCLEIIMNLQLAKKSAFVTGSSGGIGQGRASQC